MSQKAHSVRAYLGFCGIERLGVFLLRPGWDASPSQGIPPELSLSVPILYIRVERGMVRVKRLAQEHNRMSLILMQREDIARSA